MVEINHYHYHFLTRVTCTESHPWQSRRELDLVMNVKMNFSYRLPNHDLRILNTYSIRY